MMSKDFIPNANLYVDAFKVHEMMHLHQMFVRFGDGVVPTKDEIIECFRNRFGSQLSTP